MSVAKAYAKAFFQSAIEANMPPGGLDSLQLQLDEILAQINASKELRIALYSPLISRKEKAELVQAIAERSAFSPLSVQFLELLAKKGRMSLLEKIREEFAEVRLTAEGGIPGTLVTAEPISTEDQRDLARAFTQKLGKRVVFQISTDASLLAGIKVTVNGVTYDGSLRSELQRLQENIMETGL